MRKQYLLLASFLCLLVVVSCSNDETSSKNQIASRPAVPPITATEVRIGTQVWMTSNLNVSRYRNGDLIPQIQDATQWANLTTGAWCYYNNDPANGRIYGKLYNWYAVNDPRGLAPRGYHVPSDLEWSTLVTFLGSESVAGGKMKALTLWSWPNNGATNSCSFTGLPGGYCDNFGAFNSIAHVGCWWSTAEASTTVAWYHVVRYDSARCDASPHSKTVGFSVRCLRD